MDVLVTIDNNIYKLRELSRNEKIPKKFNDIKEIKTKKVYIPPMTHPWKLDSFKKQIKRSHNKHQFT